MRYIAMTIKFLLVLALAALTSASKEDIESLGGTFDPIKTRVCNIKGTLADCSCQELQKIPEDLPTNITSLNLRSNNIKYLNGTIFQRYHALTNLSLSDNELEVIDKTDFQFLSSLTTLDLSLNRIVYDNINDNAFQNMPKLYYLDLKQRDVITANTAYPTALQDLDALEYLMIDGLDSYLPHLPNLKELYLSSQYGSCYIPHLHRDIFKNLFNTNVSGIYLSNCNITNVDKGVFENFPYLEALDISWNEYLTFERMYNITFGLNGKYFKRLNTNNIYPYFKNSECVAILKEYMINLFHTSLEVWSLEGNHVIRIDPDAVHLSPRSLKYISVRDNMLMLGKYSDIIKKHQLLKHAIYFDSSKMFYSHMPPSNNFGKKDNAQSTEIVVPCSVMFTRSQMKTHFQVIDERLQKFNITNDVSSVLEKSNQSLTEYLDISECLSDTYKLMFELFDVEGLRYLNMSGTYLGYTLLDNGTMFDRFVSLTTLDISSNGIITLKEHLFDTLQKLERLYIGNNKLSNISFDVSSLKNLKYLDLKLNHIETLSIKTMKSLSSLKNITVNIAGNNLRCDCSTHNLEFLHWITTTNVVFEDYNNTVCYFVNDSSIAIRNLNFENFKLECRPPTYFVLTLVTCLCIVTFLMIIGGSLLYKYRWNLRYFYYMTKFKMAGGYQSLDDVEYDKDIFVSYANEDANFVRNKIIPELEESGHFSLLVHARDFQAGEFVADNIVRAVTSTRFTLAILTRAYIQSKWCMYEMNIARLESINTNRNVLCVIMKEDIPPKKLPVELLDILRTKTYIEYPDNEDEQEQFWKRIITTLK